MQLGRRARSLREASLFVWLLASSAVAAQARTAEDVPQQFGAPASNHLSANSGAAGYIGRTFTFRDVELQSLAKRLKWLGVRWNVPGRGRVTISLTVDLPWQHPFTAGEYRLHANLTSSEVELQGYQLRNLTAAADLAEGVLQISGSEFTLWDQQASQPAGTFRGRARLTIPPRGDLVAEIEIDKLNLPEFARRLPNLPELRSGGVTGSLTARVPYSQVREIDAWTSSGRLSIEGLKVEDLPPAHVATKFQFKRGELTLNQLAVSSEVLQLAADVKLSDRKPYPFRVDVRRATGELGNLKSVIQRFKVGKQLPAQLLGQFLASGRSEGTLQPLAWNATTSMNWSDLELDRLHVDMLRFDCRGDGHRLEIANLRSQVYGGEVIGSASLDLSKPFDGRVDLGWSGLQVAPLARDLELPLQVGRGSVSGKLAVRIPGANLSDPASWNADGFMRVDNAVVDGVSFQQLAGDFTLRDQLLIASNLRASLRQGEVKASARCELRGSFPSTCNFEARRLELATFAAWISPPVGPIRGQLSLTGLAEGKLLTRQATVRGNGNLTDVHLGGLKLDAASFGYGISQHGVALSSIDARLYGGWIRGQLTLPFSTRVDGSADISWNEIQLGRVAAELQRVEQPLSGTTAGTLRANLPAGHGFDLSQLRGSAQCSVHQGTGFGIRGAAATLALRLENGNAEVSRFNADWPGSRVRGSARIALKEPYQYSTLLAAKGSLSSSALLQLPSFSHSVPGQGSLAGRFAIQANLKGELNPLTATGNGEGVLRDVRVGEASLDSLDFKFAANGKSVILERFAAELYGGSLHGSAVIPLAADLPGRAALNISDVDLGTLARDVVHLPFKLSATVGGSVTARLPAGSLHDPSMWNFSAKVSSPSIRVNDLSVGDFQAGVDGGREKLTVRSDGQILAGRFSLRGEWHESADRAPPEASSGLLELSGLQLSKLAFVFPNNPRLRGLFGRLDASLPFSLPAKIGWPEGTGQLRITRVRMSNKPLIDRLDAVMLLRPGLLELNEVNGVVGQGMLRGNAVLNLLHPTISSFFVALDNAQMQDLVAPFPEINGVVSGTLDLELRGVLAHPWRVRGTVAMNDGHLMGMPLSDVRLPLTMSFEPSTSSLELSIPDGAGQVGHGRLQFQLTMRAMESISLNAEGRISDADLQPLLSQSGAVAQLVGGQADATFTLQGHSIRSLNGLTGSLQARLRNVQPSGLNLFQQIAPYLTGGLGGNSFTQGDLRARLGSGALSVERLSLVGSTARVYASGHVSVSGGLDLDVMASNNQLPGGVLGPVLLARVAVGVSSPVGLLLTINQFLANRVVYLDVTGTIAAPVIRVRPLPLLTNEAARFFLGGGF